MTDDDDAVQVRRDDEDDAERLGRIDWIIEQAIEAENERAMLAGTGVMNSCDIVARALNAISDQHDMDDLCNLLVMDAVFNRLEELMVQAGAVPIGDPQRRSHQLNRKKPALQ